MNAIKFGWENYKPMPCTHTRYRYFTSGGYTIISDSFGKGHYKGTSIEDLAKMRSNDLEKLKRLLRDIRRIESVLAAWGDEKVGESVKAESDPSVCWE